MAERTDAEWVAATFAVGDTLNAICNCGVPDGESEATDPRDRSVRLPHHFDCAAVEAWPAIERIIEERRQLPPSPPTPPTAPVAAEKENDA